MKNTHITNVTGTLLKATALGVGFAVALTPAFAEVVKVDIKTEAISNMRSQILAAGYLCSNEDLLADSLYYNLDSVREYALTHDGQVPSEYASLIALNNFDVIQERANRVTDTIANINANPESVSKIGGKLSPLSL